MGSVFFVEIMGAGSGHLALACAYQARAEGLLVNEHPDPNAYIEEVILGTLKRTLGVPNKSHLFVVAERTPHRHHKDGGVHGLVDYVAGSSHNGRSGKHDLVTIRSRSRQKPPYSVIRSGVPDRYRRTRRLPNILPMRQCID